MGNITNEQKKAIHVYCRELADALNSAGYDYNDHKVIKVKVSYTKDNVYETIWKSVQTALFPEKTSKADLDKNDISLIYENVNNIIASRVGTHVPFPDKRRLENE